MRALPCIPVAIAVNDCMVSVSAVDGDSMRPTFNPNCDSTDHVVLDKFSIRFRQKYVVGDVVSADGQGVLALGDRGIFSSAGVHIACAEVDTWEEPQADEDARTLAVLYGPGDNPARHRPFGNAVSKLTETGFHDWRIDGPRTLLWLLLATCCCTLSSYRQLTCRLMRRHAWALRFGLLS